MRGHIDIWGEVLSKKFMMSSAFNFHAISSIVLPSPLKKFHHFCSICTTGPSPNRGGLASPWLHQWVKVFTLDYVTTSVLFICTFCKALVTPEFIRKPREFLIDYRLLLYCYLFYFMPFIIISVL